MMGNNGALVKAGSELAPNDLIAFDQAKIDLIKRTVAKGATDDELELFMHQARRTGLDPLARQIVFQKYNTKSGPQVAFITAIDGYRLIADRTGRYAGNDEPVFDGRQQCDGKQVPVRCSVTVWKLVNGHRVPFSATAYWDEYYPGQSRGHMWLKMPHVMLAKVAESAALRKAFPADLSGMYTQEEMAQAEQGNEPIIVHQRPTNVTEDGEIVDGVIEDSEPPTPTATKPTNGNGHSDVRGAASPAAQAARESLRPSGDPLASQSLLRQLDALGKSKYGEAWESTFLDLLAEKEVASSDKLTTSQAKAMIEDIKAQMVKA